MEIALITGIGFLGKMISDSNKAKQKKLTVTNNDIYNTTMVDQATMERARIASNNRLASKDPLRTNIIPPLHPQTIFKKSEQEFGTITDMVNKESYDFSQAMDALILKKKQEVGALNDVFVDDKKKMRFVQDNIAAEEKWAPFSADNDMTYNVVDKDKMTFENMEHFTSQRDYSVYNDYNEQRSPLAIELFTGSSKNYFNKQENVAVFEPQKDVSYVNGAPVMTGIFQDRYNDAVKLERRNERPFEQRQVGPGLNLDANQDSLFGFHDTTRILPRNIDEIRRADRKQESKTEPMNHGKLGENQPVLTPWKKHQPDTFREIDPSEYLPGSSQFSAARVRDNINLRVGNRIFSQEEIGAAKLYVPAFSNTTKGEVQESSREIYREPDNQTVHYSIPKINQNSESYNIATNQRNKCNIEYGVVSNPVHSKSVVNVTDEMKNTMRQTIGELPTGAAFGQNQHTKVYNQDELRATLKQTIGELPMGSAFGQNQHVKVYNQDELRATLKQTIGELPMGAAFGQNQHNKVYNQDEVRSTLRQMLQNINKDIVQGNIKNTAMLQDIANPTLRQLINYEHTGNAGSQSLHKLKSLLQDTVRTTGKQLIDMTHDGFINDSYNKATVQLQDEVRTTTRQQADNYEYTHGPKNSQGNMAYHQDDLEDDLRETLRNISKLEDYVGSGGMSIGNMNKVDYLNAHTNESREAVSKARAPTQSGPSIMANLDNTQVALKTYQDLKRAWIPTATQAVKDLDNERNITLSLLKNKADYSDRLSYNLTKSLNDNPLVVNNKKMIRTLEAFT